MSRFLESWTREAGREESQFLAWTRVTPRRQVSNWLFCARDSNVLLGRIWSCEPPVILQAFVCIHELYVCALSDS